MENRVIDSGGEPIRGNPGKGVKRFGRVNWLGLATLTGREVRRFTNVWTQTLAAPVATALLFMAVFTLALGTHRPDVMGLPFAHFLAPGILMMTVIQNAFANTSSSILVSKVQGSIVDTLMPPLSPSELLTGFVLGGVLRGLFVALGVAAVLFPLIGIIPAHPLWALAFILTGSALMALLGMITGILAQKFDHMAAITNFVITPLSFLSGTFYSTASVPDAFRMLLHLNPIFYLIDGMRFGALGVSDSPPALGLGYTLIVVCLLAGLTLHWLRTGYRLKS